MYRFEFHQSNIFSEFLNFFLLRFGELLRAFRLMLREARAAQETWDKLATGLRHFSLEALTLRAAGSPVQATNLRLERAIYQFCGFNGPQLVTLGLLPPKTKMHVRQQEASRLITVNKLQAASQLFSSPRMTC